jgi:CheY-like chemotaxis protein
MGCPVVLIVEDEPIVALDLARTVLEAGYALCGTAASGPEALALAELNPPTVAIVDVRLIGRMDGIEVARRLHGQFNTQAIVLTADPIATTRARIEFPHIEVMAKPYLASTLRAVLVKACADDERPSLPTSAVA